MVKAKTKAFKKMPKSELALVQLEVGSNQNVSYSMQLFPKEFVQQVFLSLPVCHGITRW